MYEATAEGCSIMELLDAQAKRIQQEQTPPAVKQINDILAKADLSDIARSLRAISPHVDVW